MVKVKLNEEQEKQLQGLFVQLVSKRSHKSLSAAKITVDALGLDGEEYVRKAKLLSVGSPIAMKLLKRA